MKICSNCKIEKSFKLFYLKNKKHPEKGLRAMCINCTNQKNNAYRRKHKQKLKEKNKIWEQNNKDKALARQKRYRKKHPERVAQRQKAWRVKNPEKLRLYDKAKYAARKNATLHKFTVEQLNMRMSMFDNRCAYCGGIFEHIDHLYPISLGGPHCLSNLRPACKNCNLRKHNTPAKLWLKMIKD